MANTKEVEVVEFQGIVGYRKQNSSDRYGIKLQDREEWFNGFGECPVKKGDTVIGRCKVKVKNGVTYRDIKEIQVTQPAEAGPEPTPEATPIVLRGDALRVREKALGCAVTFSAGRTKDECVEVARYFEEEYLLAPSSSDGKVRQYHLSTARLKLIDSQTKEVIDAGSVKELIDQGVLSDSWE